MWGGHKWPSTELTTRAGEDIGAAEDRIYSNVAHEIKRNVHTRRKPHFAMSEGALINIGFTRRNEMGL
jgi:hypothetical protein